MNFSEEMIEKRMLPAIYYTVWTEGQKRHFMSSSQILQNRNENIQHMVRNTLLRNEKFRLMLNV